MYEVGKVYIWQNVTERGYEYLNGSETTVIGPAKNMCSLISGETSYAQETDSYCKRYKVNCSAKAGKLRPKNPPSGEQLVRDMFQPKPVMEPA